MIPGHSPDSSASHEPANAVKNGLLRNPFLRNMLILSSLMIIALISYNFFLITPSFTKLLIQATEGDAVRISRHLASSNLGSEETVIGKDSLNLKKLKDEAETIKNDFGLMNFKIFSPAGEILFSADPGEEGEINRREYFHNIVAQGKVFAKVVPKDKESLEGRKVTRDVLETYVPIMNKGKFLGVFEIYYDITDRKKHLDKLLSQSSILIMMFASGLFIAIIFILHQENLAMKKRRQLEKERLQKERLQGVIEMAGAACHELNQPLQAISGYSQFLISDVSEDNPLFPEIKKIKEMTDRLGKITRKIMHITRYETMDYVEGSKIIDIDKASSSEISPEEKV